MRLTVNVLIVILIALAAVATGYQRDRDERQPQPELPKLWPRPQQVTFGVGRSELRSPCDLRLALPQQLQAFPEYNLLFEHYKWKIFKRVDCVMKLNTLFDPVHDTAASDADTFTIQVEIADATAPGYPSLKMSENYTLFVNGSAARLTADSYFGFVRGLETFSQLVSLKPGRNETATWTSFYIPGTPINILDFPRLKHRGVMLDTARHYLSVRTIRRTIDALMYNKMNVLHWHIIDADSFPLYLEKKPYVTLAGAFTPKLIYIPAQIRELVEYARARGVRIIPEIESPGHTRSWGLSAEYNDILSCPTTNGACAQPPCGQIHPDNPKTIELVTEIIAQVNNLFPDEVVHFGADEIKPECWSSDPKYANKDVQGLCVAFQEKQRSILGKEKKGMYWGDSNYKGQDNDIIQFWNSYAAIPGRYKVISYASDFYLDCGLSNLFGQDAVWCDPFKTWKQMLHKSIDAELSDPMFLGAENPFFGEMNNDGTTDNKIWPRASGTAELLWSSPLTETPNEVLDRLSHHVSRLWWRGIASTPATTTYCAINPQKC